MPRLTPSLFLALVLFTQPAAAAISPETPLNTPVYGESPFQQYAVDAASDGLEYLAVWRDYRGERVVLAAARVSAAGEVLDPNGIVIADIIDDLNIGEVRVAWNGSSYVVVWDTFGHASDVWLARVDRRGEVLTAPRRIIEKARLGDVAANGSRTLITYGPGPTLMHQEVRAALADENGNITNDSLLAPADAFRFLMRIVAHGRGWVTMWTRNLPPSMSVTEALRIDERGMPLDQAPRRIADAHGYALASDGTDLMVIASGARGWIAAPVSGDLSQVRDSVVLPISLSQSQPSLAWTGERYVAVSNPFEPPRKHLLLMHLDRDGRLLDTATAEPLDTNGSVGQLATTTRNGHVLLTWVEGVSTPSRFRSQVVGTVIPPAELSEKTPAQYLSIVANHQTDPAVAFGASMMAVAWLEPDGVYATRFANGRSLDGRGLRLDSGVRGLPRIAFDGTQFVIAWHRLDDRVAKIRFLSPDRGLLPDQIETVNNSLLEPLALAGGRGTTLVAWQGNDQRIHAMSIDAATRMISNSPLTLSPEGEMAESPVAAWNGTDFLVAWDVTATRPVLFFPYFTVDHARVEGVRLSADFVLRDPRPLLIGDLAGTEDRVLSIASNGDGWLVAWKNGFQGSIRARHVKRDGNADGAIEGSVVGDGSAADVAWDGNRYAIAWKAAGRPQTIRLAYLTSIDPIIAGPAISVAATERHQRQIALTSPAPLQIALVYGRFTTEEIYAGVSRLFMRVSTTAPKRRAAR